MNSVRIVALATVFAFSWFCQMACAQFLINYQFIGTFETPTFVLNGVTASAKTGVFLSDGSGIGVLGGLTNGVDENEVLRFDFPFAIDFVTLNSMPSFVNSDFVFEGFLEGRSVGSGTANFFDFTDSNLPLLELLGVDRIDALELTGGQLPDFYSRLNYDEAQLLNNSFEVSDSGTTDVSGWTSSGNVTTFEGNSVVGDQSVRLMASGSADRTSVSQTYAGNFENRFVRAGGYAINSSFDPLTGDNFGRVELDFLDASGQEIDLNPLADETAVLSPILDASNALEELANLNTEFVSAPADAVACRVTLSHIQPTGTGAGSIFFDNVTIEISPFPIAGSFFPLGSDHFESQTANIAANSSVFFEIDHDGVSPFVFTSESTGDEVEFAIYNQGGFRLAQSDVPSDQDNDVTRLEINSLPAGEYIVAAAVHPATFGFGFVVDAGSSSSVDVTLNLNGEAPSLPPVEATFSPVSFSFLDSDNFDPPDDGTPVFFEVVYDGLAPLTIEATDSNVGELIDLALFKTNGVIIETSDNGLLEFDSLEAGTYILALNNFLTIFDFGFVASSTASVEMGPTTVTFTTGEPDFLPGDVNCDGVVDLLDIQPFIERLQSSEYDPKADVNLDGAVNLLDVSLFIDAINSTGG